MRLKFKMTKKSKICTVATMLLVMIVFGVISYLQSDRVGHALKSKNFLSRKFLVGYGAKPHKKKIWTRHTFCSIWTAP